MEALRGHGRVPAAAPAPSQAERFEVLEGELRAVVDGSERRYGGGESFGVPPDATHDGGEVPTARAGRSAPRCAPPSSSSACTAAR